MFRFSDHVRFDALNGTLANVSSRRSVCKRLALLAVVASGLARGTASPTAAQEATGTPDDSLRLRPEQGAEIDSDGDSLSDQEENYWGLNPFRADTDGDGLGDGDEFYDRYTRSDPSLYDTDFDGLSDGAEVFGRYGYRTDPFYSDTDWDGRGDGEEIFQYGSNPLRPDH